MQLGSAIRPLFTEPVTYIPDSLKESTRENMGKGVRRKLSGETELPSYWIDFLREPSNKKEIFVVLTIKIF